MTETYYALISTDRDREIARAISSECFRETDKYIRYHSGKVRTIGDTCSCSECSEFIIPFPDFIQRFFPLTVVAGLASAHGYGLAHEDYLKTVIDEKYMFPFNPEDMRKDDER
jgi:hypothetical protein